MRLPKGRYVAVDTEGDTHHDLKKGPLMPWEGGESFLFSWYTELGEYGACGITPQTIPFIAGILSSKRYIKIFQYALYDIIMLRAKGIFLRGAWHDTFPMSHLLDEFGNHSIDALAEKWCGRKSNWKDAPRLWLKANRDATMRDVPREIIEPYAIKDVKETLLVFMAIWPMIKKDFLPLYTLERQVILAAARMEERGVAIDFPFCRAEIQRLTAEAKRQEAKIYSAAGQPFNINSSQQMATAFERMGIRLTEKTEPSKRFPNGQWAFDEEALTLYASRGLTIVKEIVAYKLCLKLISTYFAKFIEAEGTKDRRLHPSINTIGRESNTVVSGRMSISKPSLQNLAKPKNEKEESLIKVRKGIIPARGFTLVKADYDQEEFKLTAEFAWTLAGDETLVKKFEEDPRIDFHKLVTAIVFQIAVEMILKGDYRRDICKTINFAILYGAMERRIAEELTKRTGRLWTIAETSQILQRYHASLPAIRRLMFYCSREIVRHGFIRDIFGRCYRLPAELKYMATNRLVQGTAATVLKIATVRVNSRILKEDRKAHILFPVHDELLLECRPEAVPSIDAMLHHEMTRDLPFRVPLTVTVTEMQNYLEKRESKN